MLVGRTYALMSEAGVAGNALINIAKTPVPFPYCQMSAIMLNLFAVTWPLVTALLIDDTAWAMGMCFIVTFAFFAFDAIAAELQVFR